MLFLVFLVTVPVLAITYYWIKISDYWRKRNAVQVNETFLEHLFTRKPLADIYRRVYQEHPNEPYVGVLSGTTPSLLLRDLTNVQSVMVSDFKNFHCRGVSTNDHDILSDNVLMINEYKRWKLLRHKLTPMFTSMKLKNMFYILDTCARDFVQRIKENPKIVENSFDALFTYTTSSITASVFGIDANVRNTMDSPLLHMAKNAMENNWSNHIKFIMMSTVPSFILNSFNFKLFSRFERRFIEAVRQSVENRRETGEKRHDLVDLCLELQKQGPMKDATTNYEIEPTVEVLAAQGWFFFLAGTDASANAMHFTLLELASNPDILKKVHDEIDQVLDECDEKFTYSEMEKLQYLEMVCNEAMRKYPPAGVVQRLCTNTTKLPVGGLTMEKDCLVLIPIFGIHRDPKYYPNPDKFDPERFSPENISKIPKFAYLPFGDGGRNCIGARYAQLQVKAGLVWVLRKFTLRPQKYEAKAFEPSFVAVKDSKSRYDLIPRDK